MEPFKRTPAQNRKTAKRQESEVFPMRQRGRKSSASLSVVPVSFEARRPPPPAHLNAIEKKTWRDIVNSCPAGWFSVAQEPLLAAYCCHESAARFLSKLIEKSRPADLFADRDKLRRYAKLLTMRSRETAALSALATRMRLTQQARIQPRSAGRAWDANHSGPKLWDRPWEDK
jgi:hypothetical protein